MRQLAAGHAGRLVQRQVVHRLAVDAVAGAREQLGQHAFVHIRALAQVHGSQVKAEYGHCLLQAAQAQAGDGRAVARR
ncbi:Uncharacterised protein [Bordetella pertussis]|nr:Uncharacterised protein [Bordetella pertussis]CPJ60971.1 Uncharacterised protein [Bordetella pertussis]CPM35615.1 Uncharacterised protein [Bordetella pertussis]CPN61364.1 Uncharacterised protein [Bordetella pertussis]